MGSKRYQRSEQAFVLALMEMVVQGVSLRKVSAITEELCGAAFEIDGQRACAGLDGRVRAFSRRRLGATYRSFWSMRCSSSREGDRTSFTRRAGGIGHPQRRLSRDSRREDRRHRELRHLGRDFPLAQGPWSARVMFVVSDSHGGLTQATAKHFRGASWQRCQVHLMRNLLARTGESPC